MKKYILICCFFVFTIPVKAQEKTMKLSLEEAISFAVKNSYNARTSLNDIESAKKKVWETTTIGLPQIDGKIDYQNALKRQFPGVDFDQDGIIDFNAKHAANAGVTLRQLIFDGSYLVGLQAAKTFLKISEQAAEKTTILTKEAVINAYGNVLIAESSLKILKGNIKILEKSYLDSKKINENGFNEEEDVEQLEITLGSLKNQLKNVQRMKGIAYKMLNLSLGNSIETPLILTDSLDSLLEKSIDLKLVSESFNFSNHIDYKIAENNKETKRLMMRLEQSKALPTLYSFVNYNFIANSETFTFFNSSQQWINTSVLGVSLNVPIFSSFGRKAKTTQAKIALENANIKLQETKQRLSLLAQKAKGDYQLSIENYNTAKRNVGLAERIEKKQRIKFFEGISSSFDLMQAQNQLYTQQQNYIQSMLNVIAKKTTLENALNLSTK